MENIHQEFYTHESCCTVLQLTTVFFLTAINDNINENIQIKNVILMRLTLVARFFSCSSTMAPQSSPIFNATRYKKLGVSFTLNSKD